MNTLRIKKNKMGKINGEGMGNFFFFFFLSQRGKKDTKTPI